MPADAELFERLGRLVREVPGSGELVRRVIEHWAARQDIAERSRLLKHLVLRYAAAEEELFRLSRELGRRQQCIEEDLAAAGEIQRRLLPRAPQAGGRFAAAWLFQPSAAVGGDLFNVMRLDEHRWGLYALDVGGHGVPAAMVAVSVYQDLQPYSPFVRRADPAAPAGYALASPAEVLAALEREYPFERFANFFTIVYLIFDTAADAVLASSAGHPPPVLVRRGGRVEVLQRGGPVIGLRSEGEAAGGPAGFTEVEAAFGPGDRLFVYTDGLVEFQNREGEFFGRPRLLELLKSGRSAAAAVEAVRAALAEFGGGAAPADDVTLLGIEPAARLTS
jgi:sigma-B regulation protein RsbU (phosphoserine phosphatase)